MGAMCCSKLEEATRRMKRLLVRLSSGGHSAWAMLQMERQNLNSAKDRLELDPTFAMRCVPFCAKRERGASRGVKSVVSFGGCLA